MEMEPLAYLLPREVLLGKSELLSFTQIGTENFSPINSWKEGSEHLPKYMYVAHSWYDEENIDDEQHTKFQTIRKTLESLKSISHVWIEYSCIDYSNNEHKSSCLANIAEIVDKASRVLILPHRPMGRSSFPVYDLQYFGTWAWCIFETCFILKRPSKIRLVQVTEDSDGVVAHMAELPVKDQSYQVERLLESFTNIEAMVKSGDRERFLTQFRVSSGQDPGLLWEALVRNQADLFAGRRHALDFFQYDAQDVSFTPSPTKEELQGLLAELKGEAEEIEDCFHLLEAKFADCFGSLDHLPSDLRDLADKLKAGIARVKGADEDGPLGQLDVVKGDLRELHAALEEAEAAFAAQAKARQIETSQIQSKSAVKIQCAFRCYRAREAVIKEWVESVALAKTETKMPVLGVGGPTEIQVPEGAELRLKGVTGHRTCLGLDGKTFTVYFLDVECRQATPATHWRVYRRYAQFFDLSKDLKASGAQVPQIPKKQVLNNRDPKFTAERQADLATWMGALVDQNSEKENAFGQGIQAFPQFRSFVASTFNTFPGRLVDSPAAEGEDFDKDGKGALVAPDSTVQSQSEESVPPEPLAGAQDGAVPLALMKYRHAREVCQRMGVDTEGLHEKPETPAPVKVPAAPEKASAPEEFLASAPVKASVPEKASAPKEVLASAPVKASVPKKASAPEKASVPEEVLAPARASAPEEETAPASETPRVPLQRGRGKRRDLLEEETVPGSLKIVLLVALSLGLIAIAAACGLYWAGAGSGAPAAPEALEAQPQVTEIEAETVIKPKVSSFVKFVVRNVLQKTEEAQME